MIKKYSLLYNRLTEQGIGPKEAPAYVYGENPKEALKNTFGYAFRRIYGEAAKSPDIILFEGEFINGTMIRDKTAGRYSYAAMCKASKERKPNESSKFPRDPKTQRFIKRKVKS